MITAPTSVTIRAPKNKKSLLSQSSSTPTLYVIIPTIFLSIIFSILVVFWVIEVFCCWTRGHDRVFPIYFALILLFSSLWQLVNLVGNFYVPKNLIFQMFLVVLLSVPFEVWVVHTFLALYLEQEHDSSFLWPVEIGKCLLAFALPILLIFCALLQARNFFFDFEQFEQLRFAIRLLHSPSRSILHSWFFYTLHVFGVLSSFKVIEHFWQENKGCKIGINILLVSTVPPIASTLITSLNSFWKIGHFIRSEAIEKYHLTPKQLEQKQPVLKADHSKILVLVITSEIITESLPIFAAEVFVGWLYNWKFVPCKQVESRLRLCWLPVRVACGVFLGNLSNWKGSWRYWQNVANIVHWRGDEVLLLEAGEFIYDMEAEACKVPLPSDEEFV